MTVTIDDEKLAALNKRWATFSAEKILDEAIPYFFGEIGASTHAGRESALMLEVLRQGAHRLPVIYIDDPKTRAFAKVLEKRFNLRFLHIPPHPGKLEALQNEMSRCGMRCVIHGVRGYQNDNRGAKEILELGVDGIYRLHPLLWWTREEVAAFFQEHGLPYHPDLPEETAKEDCELQCVPRRAATMA